jgi:hypothetical protein
VCVAGASVALALGAACSAEPTFDRAGAVDVVLRDSGGQLTRSQAECYVDRVVAELGSSALDGGAQARPEYLPQLTRIRVDCTGVASLGTQAPTSASTIDANLGSRPQKPGDDPELDALADACRATGGAACDELFTKSVLGSAYEELASTCGGRTKELSCAAAYPPGASPASSTSTTAAAVPSSASPPSTANASSTTVTTRVTTTTRR